MVSCILNLSVAIMVTSMEILASGGNRFRIDSLSKEFFTCVPHSFGLIQPLLDNQDIIKVFKINRHAEKERHPKFKELHNKKLLWHGSRLCNHTGILSRGLCIAPREAGTSGGMFGNGVYFADMVTKSAPYCGTSKNNPTCILLLCEVALGNMYNKARSESLVNLPPNMHSTLGMGMREPNPAVKTYIGDVEVPYGKPIRRKNGTGLPFNEYVVYDTNQIRIKYLLRAKCDFKH